MGKYKNYSNACANPLFNHKKPIITGLCPFTSEMKSKFDTEMQLKEEKYVCTNCFNKIKKLPSMFKGNKIEKKIISSSSSSTSSLQHTFEKEVFEEYLCADETNETLKRLFVSPIKTHGLSAEKKRKTLMDKYERATKALKSDLELSFQQEISLEECNSSQSNDQNVESFSNILEELKEEYKKASYERKLQILTLSPFTITKTISYFGATKYLVNKARALKKEYGILPEVPKYSKGKILSDGQIKEVIFFYEDDEISRLCPGKSDYVSVRMADGKKEHVQKRLLLSNLKEIFTNINQIQKILLDFPHLPS